MNREIIKVLKNCLNGKFVCPNVPTHLHISGFDDWIPRKQCKHMRVHIKSGDLCNV